MSRRVYNVPWPNSLRHLDGHHYSLIRWGFAIHGCVDGYSRRTIFLRCSTNNLASTVIHLFETAIEEDDGLWLSRIRVDYGVENTAVCDAMVAVRGSGRGGFIAGSSTRNQRIERLWRDVYRCVCHVFYYTFYAMEQTGLLNLENQFHMLTFQCIFLPRFNFSLSEWRNTFNHHPMSTEHSWSLNQLWLNGMMDPNNPLANGNIDDNPDNLIFYIEDMNGPIPFQDDNVVVTPMQLPNDDTKALVNFLLNALDPTKESSRFGIDVFAEALQLVVQWLENVQSSSQE